MSDANMDPGGYRADDRGSQWLVPLLLGLIALAAIAWVLFAQPFGDAYGTTATDSRPAATAVAPATGSGGASGTTSGGAAGTTSGGTTTRP
jgi:hypothetical protein